MHVPGISIHHVLLFYHKPALSRAFVVSVSKHEKHMFLPDSWMRFSDVLINYKNHELWNSPKALYIQIPDILMSVWSHTLREAGVLQEFEMLPRSKAEQQEVPGMEDMEVKSRNIGALKIVEGVQLCTIDVYYCSIYPSLIFTIYTCDIDCCCFPILLTSLSELQHERVIRGKKEMYIDVY